MTFDFDSSSGAALRVRAISVTAITSSSAGTHRP
jgi:hypothetical protein